MAKSHWLINPKRTEVKRFIKNDKRIDGVFEYMFVDTGKIVGVLGKEPPVITTTVSVDIDLAREIYERLISQGWRKTEEVWRKKRYLVLFSRNLLLLNLLNCGRVTRLKSYQATLHLELELYLSYLHLRDLYKIQFQLEFFSCKLL